MENTTQSLSISLNNLIKAYEDLQKENVNLKVQLKDLKAQKAQVEGDLSNISSSKQKQSQDINSMVSKINTLLKTEDMIVQKEEVRPEPSTTVQLEIEPDDESIISRPQESSDSKSKIDLNKMESLLNGFGGNS